MADKLVLPTPPLPVSARILDFTYFLLAWNVKKYHYYYILCTRKFQWFCRAPPLRAQFRYSCRGGALPRPPKRETPPSFACGKIHRPCQGRQASYRKPLIAADSPLRRGHYPRWASNQPVISFRRRSRCFGLPLRESSWFSPRKRTRRLSTPCAASAEYI